MKAPDAAGFDSQPGVRVRMYNVGFGDCFLIQLPDRVSPRLVLIDCGVHSASKEGKPLKEIVDRVIADVKALVGRPRIDVVVATHRHRDHVHGFDNPAWLDVEVGEVWLPWTENPVDPVARELLERQSRRALQLSVLAADGGDERMEAIEAIADNTLKNADAMAMLHHGFAGSPKRHFLPEISEEGGEDDNGPARTLSFSTSPCRRPPGDRHLATVHGVGILPPR